MLTGLARGRALIAGAVMAAAALSGCTNSSSSTQTVSGSTLTIYASAPPAAKTDARAQDVLAAEELAFAGSGGHAGNFKLKLVVLRGTKTSDNARTAISDDTAIAYLGEIIPGESADSLGIVGDQSLLQVSPTDNAVELTQGSQAVSGAPGVYYEQPISSGRTFARLAPTSAREAKAIVAQAQALHVSKLYVTDDGLHYGAALAAAAAQAGGTAVSVVHGPPTAARFSASGANGLLYATTSRSAATSLFDAVAQTSPAVKLFAPSALDDASFATGLSSAAQAAVQISAPGYPTADLPASGRKFVQAFEAAYHHAPATEAIFGYEAMSAVIGVLTEAHGGAADRSTVLHDFFAIRNRSSVLGTYSISTLGDTSIAPFVFSRVRSGRLDPYKYVPEQG